ncbi:MAG: hypothetical protein JWL70_3166 [Acidimicrobiia bacterium]|nr:hypothetical protein [Acidimicrobiia bacterium]
MDQPMDQASYASGIGSCAAAGDLPEWRGVACS